MLTLEQALAALPPDRRERVERNAQKLIEEERVRRRLREARRLTQKTLGEAFHADQARISKIETSSDFMLSTLQNHVEAMGGSLRLVAEFPDGRYEFSSLSDTAPEASQQELDADPDAPRLGAI